MGMFAVWYKDHQGKTLINIVEAESKAIAKQITRSCVYVVVIGAVMEVRNRG